MPGGTLVSSLLQLFISCRVPDPPTRDGGGGIEELQGLPDMVSCPRQLIFLEVGDQQSDRGAPLKPGDDRNGIWIVGQSVNDITVDHDTEGRHGVTMNLHSEAL